MTPVRIAIGIICAVAVAAGRRAYALAAAVVLSVALMACAATPPAVSDEPPVSALRIYEAGEAAGRKAALEDLRAQPIFAHPVNLSVCPDKVSWLPRRLNIPEDIWIGSRKENMKLKKACRDGEIEKAYIIRKQREAVESAE